MAGFQEFWDKWKWWIIAALTIVAIIVAVIVLYFVVFKKKEGFVSSFTSEGFSGFDEKVYADQFKYAESYINSVLGQETEITKLATVVATPVQTQEVTPAPEASAVNEVKPETTPAPEQQSTSTTISTEAGVAGSVTIVGKQSIKVPTPGSTQVTDDPGEEQPLTNPDKAKESMRRYYY